MGSGVIVGLVCMVMLVPMGDALQVEEEAMRSVISMRTKESLSPHYKDFSSNLGLTLFVADKLKVQERELNDNIWRMVKDVKHCVAEGGRKRSVNNPNKVLPGAFALCDEEFRKQYIAPWISQEHDEKIVNTLGTKSGTVFGKNGKNLIDIVHTHGGYKRISDTGMCMQCLVAWYECIQKEKRRGPDACTGKAGEEDEEDEEAEAAALAEEARRAEETRRAEEVRRAEEARRAGGGSGAGGGRGGSGGTGAGGGNDSGKNPTVEQRPAEEVKDPVRSYDAEAEATGVYEPPAEPVE